MIPEAAVEAALYALFPDEPDMKEFKSVFWLPTINTILEAAAPHMMAGVWDESHFDALGCDGTCCDLMHDAPRKSMNPYRPTP